MILPLAVLCVVLTGTDNVVARDFVSIAILPPWCLAAWTVLGILVNQRLLHPPDVGSEGKDVVDEEEEMKYAIGVVIDRDLFPDKLFAPAKRADLIPDGTNPVLDKELRARSSRHVDAAGGHPGQHVAVDSAHGRVFLPDPTRQVTTLPTCLHLTCWLDRCFPPVVSLRRASGKR